MDIAVNKIEINKFHLLINFTIVCKKEALATVAKATVIFTNNHFTRRLPVKLIHAEIDEFNDTAIFSFENKYLLKYLYNHNDINGLAAMKINFYFSYGNTNTNLTQYRLDNTDIVSDKNYFKIASQENMLILQPNKNRINRYFKNIKIKGIIRNIHSIFLPILIIPILPLVLVHFILKVLGIYKIIPMLIKEIGKFIKINKQKIFEYLFYASFSFMKLFPMKKDSILFLSDRRDDMTGNFEFVNHELIKDKSLLIRKMLISTPNQISIKNKFKRLFYIATSKIILLDDYYPIIYKMKLRKETKLIQLWHACGAFKTFGFSRVGKKGGPKQSSSNHRNYDYAIVSSIEIAKFYAEGFGISENKVIATGVPRTDVFFDQEYKLRKQKDFYNLHPEAIGKKIILFSPTFRGNGKKSANYPKDRFTIGQMYHSLGEKYFIIIKNHPFVKNKIEIPDYLKNFAVDLSENTEINDLLFVSDVVITDYSSVIFEASLLDIPMLFYAYDLDDYVSNRDFYYDFRSFVPGKIVNELSDVIDSIKNEDYEQTKIESFKHRFFDDLDGHSTTRVVTLIKQVLRNSKED